MNLLKYIQLINVNIRDNYFISCLLMNLCDIRLINIKTKKNMSYLLKCLRN